MEFPPPSVPLTGAHLPALTQPPTFYHSPYSGYLQQQQQQQQQYVPVGGSYGRPAHVPPPHSGMSARAPGNGVSFHLPPIVIPSSRQNGNGLAPTTTTYHPHPMPTVRLPQIQTAANPMNMMQGYLPTSSTTSSTMVPGNGMGSYAQRYQRLHYPEATETSRYPPPPPRRLQPLSRSSGASSTVSLSRDEPNKPREISSTASLKKPSSSFVTKRQPPVPSKWKTSQNIAKEIRSKHIRRKEEPLVEEEKVESDNQVAARQESVNNVNLMEKQESRMAMRNNVLKECVSERKEIENVPEATPLSVGKIQQTASAPQPVVLKPPTNPDTLSVVKTAAVDHNLVEKIRTILEMDDSKSSSSITEQEFTMAIFQYFQAQGDASKRDVLAAMEKYLRILPNTDMHAKNQRLLERFLREKDFPRAIQLAKDVYRDATFQVLGLQNTSMEDSFDHLMYVLERFQCVKAIQLEQQTEARKLLCGSLFSHVRKHERDFDATTLSEGEVNAVRQMQAEFRGLCKLYTEQFRVPISVLMNSEESEELVPTSYANWDFQQETDKFWANVIAFHQQAPRNVMEEPWPKYVVFVAAFFVDRRGKLEIDRSCFEARITLESLRQMLRHVGQDSSVLAIERQDSDIQLNQTMKPKVAASMPVVNDRTEQEPEIIRNTSPLEDPATNANVEPRETHVLPPPSPPPVELTRKQPVNASSISDHSTTIQPPKFTTIERDPLPPIESSWEISLDEKQQPEDSAAADLSLELLHSVGPLPTRVEAMDMVEDNQGNLIVCVAWREKKSISFYNATQGELLYQHRTRKPVTSLRFFRNRDQQDNCWLLFGEFKDIVLFDWRLRQVVRRWQLHRNVVLQLDFVPPLKAKFGRGTGSRHLGISLAFDHSIKMWDLSDSAEQPQLVEKIHSSSNQPFTAFCFRKPADSENPELVVTQDKGIFKIFKLRGQGSLHLVHNVTINAVKVFPKVAHIEVDPFNLDQFLCACEADNRVFIVDVSSCEIVKQFSGRYFTLDKYAYAGFSPCGEFVFAGNNNELSQQQQQQQNPGVSSNSSLMKPTPPKMPSPYLIKRPSPYSHRTHHMTDEQAQGMDLRGRMRPAEAVNTSGLFLWHVQNAKIVKSIRVKNADVMGVQAVLHGRWVELQDGRRHLVTIGSDHHLRLYSQ